MNRTSLSTLAAFILAAAPLRAETPSAASLIEQGDRVFSSRTAESGAREALDLYEQALNVEPNNGEILWRKARAMHWWADHAPSKREKAARFEAGIETGKAAVAADPKSPAAHFWLGALYGSYGEAKGVLKSLKMVGPIREEMEAVNKLDETYQGGAGHRVLGVVDYKVPGFAGGSNKRAEKRLARALEIDPENPFNLFYMAEFLAETGQKKQAAAFLSRLAQSKTSPDVDGPDLEMIQRKGEKLRERID